MNALTGEIINTYCQGNPGAVEALAALTREMAFEDWIGTLLDLKQKGLLGAKIYMLWNDACDRDGSRFANLLVDIGCGLLPLATVEAHLAEGRCRPFRREEYGGLYDGED